VGVHHVSTRPNAQVGPAARLTSICFPHHGIQSTWFIKERNSDFFTIRIGRIRGGVSHPRTTPTGCRCSCSYSAYPTHCSRSATRLARRHRQVLPAQREALCYDTEALRSCLLLRLCHVSPDADDRGGRTRIRCTLQVYNSNVLEVCCKCFIRMLQK
jgi:hypothetical protein